MTALHVVSNSAAKGYLDIQRIRQEFPILRQQIHGKPLVYLDNAASCQKPQAVIDAIVECYSGYYANIHRGVHTLSERSTAAYEQAREKTRAFLNAKSTREIIFTSGTTAAINLVATSYGQRHVKAGDEILISTLEHHSNIVPWQMLCERQGARLQVAPIDDNGELLLDEYRKLLNDRTRLVAIAHVSNALGTINPVREIIDLAHAKGIPVLLDGAQAVPHLAVDVQALDCDFYAFSSHKLYGPSGVGVLYGKAELLEAMPPYQGGGDMIRTVTFAKTEYADLPHKFEAGTPNIADVIGLGAALDWVQGVGLDAIAAHEQDLLEYASARCRQIPGITIIGAAPHKAAVLSFTLDGVHPHDVGTLLDQEGVAVRTGHHCAQPVMDRFGVPATARLVRRLQHRAEIDALAAAIWKAKELFHA
ncbi:MAG: cysteine desulfurase [Gammaproteobacteria bacterium]